PTLFRSRESRIDGAPHGCAHGTLVRVVRTWRWNRHLPQRQAQRVGLRFDEIEPDGVHRDSSCTFVDGRQKRADLDVIAPPQDMHHPRTVFAARPGNEDPHLNASGWRVAASRRTASATRGPGTTNSSPTSRYTRPVF